MQFKNTIAIVHVMAGMHKLYYGIMNAIMYVLPVHDGGCAIAPLTEHKHHYNRFVIFWEDNYHLSINKQGGACAWFIHNQAFLLLVSAYLSPKPTSCTIFVNYFIHVVRLVMQLHLCKFN